MTLSSSLRIRLAVSLETRFWWPHIGFHWGYLSRQSIGDSLAEFHWKLILVKVLVASYIKFHWEYSSYCGHLVIFHWEYSSYCGPLSLN